MGVHSTMPWACCYETIEAWVESRIEDCQVPEKEDLK